MFKRIFLGSIVTLFLGGCIYILFRSSSLKMFTWFRLIGIDDFINITRLQSLSIANHLPKWIIFSLADGLWIFSYINLILVLWNYVISSRNIIWIGLMPTISMISEIGQFFNLVPGTFDIIDLFFYATGTVVPFIIYRNKIVLLYHEKAL